jgi:hypothetical protein
MSRRHAASFVIAFVFGFVVAGSASAQAESKSAEATRKKLQQKIDKYEAKDIGTKDFLTDILKNEIDKEIRFFVDNGSGVSNNTKLSMKITKTMTVEQVLNDFSDKMDCGWFVESNVGNNAKDGRVVVRKNSKGKERGYEFGKEPKKKAAAPVEQRRELPAGPIVTASREDVLQFGRRD